MKFQTLKIAMLLLCFYTISMYATVPFKKTYDIEVIIFTHITTQTLQTEQWPLISEDAINALDQKIAPMKTIPTHVLSREEAAMSRDPHYKILLHTAWQTTWSSGRSTITIPIQTATTTSDSTQLKGFMTMHLSRYFDAHINLMLTKPMQELQKLDIKNYFSSMKTPNFTFQLKQEQRMRSNELNYIGNPLIGILIKIMPEKSL